jgi:enoyl-CoA hydratase/carnithine racemase
LQLISLQLPIRLPRQRRNYCYHLGPKRVGIVNRIVPAADLEKTVYDMARTLATRSAAAIAATKESIRVLAESAPINPATFEYLHGLRRDVYFGPDYHEGTAAFLEKRKPKF